MMLEEKIFNCKKSINHLFIDNSVNLSNKENELIYPAFNLEVCYNKRYKQVEVNITTFRRVNNLINSSTFLYDKLISLLTIPLGRFSKNKLDTIYRNTISNLSDYKKQEYINFSIDSYNKGK